jgi:2-polyprenyl-6-methoxyphenol hydroxylase-like FAD-dependent oxidoreductase
VGFPGDAAAEAAGNPTFTLLRSHEAVDVLRADGRVRGVAAQGPGGRVEVRAEVTVAADGRSSAVRQALGWTPHEFGAPMDVLWFRVSRHGEDDAGLQMRVGAGRLLLTIDRGDYWQIAYVIPKGGYDAVVAGGVDAFRAAVAGVAPPLADRVGEISGWDDVRMLTVQVNRLRRWHAPGVLLIGDAAHAMSPVGGVGINLAVQDAVAAARVLVPAARAGRLSDVDLGRVRRRRRFPTAGTQLIQRAMQRGVLRTGRSVAAPAPLKVLRRWPALQALPARLIGVGLRPEHLPAGH